LNASDLERRSMRPHETISQRNFSGFFEPISDPFRKSLMVGTTDSITVAADKTQAWRCLQMPFLEGTLKLSAVHDPATLPVTMRRLFIKIAMVVLAIGLIAVVYFRWMGEGPVAVAIRAAEKGAVEKTVSNTRSGTVKACRRSALSPDVGGRIAFLHVKEGDRVEEGRVLLELWNDDLKDGVDLAEKQLAAGEAAALEVCTQADTAERERKRRVGLLEKGLISEEHFDRASSDAKARRAGCDAALARVKVLAAELSLARARLEKTVLAAPFSGVVAEVNGEIGEFLTPSPLGIPTKPAIDLMDTGCLYVSAPIDEVDAASIQTGLDARISLDAFRDRSFPGKVRWIAPYVLEVEKQARTVEVEVAFDGDFFRELLAGYSADVEISIDKREDVVRIPTEAVVKGDRVFVFDRVKGVIGERRIEKGLSGWRFTEVVSGLGEGEPVVTSVDRKGVVDGARVRPEEP